MTMIYIQSDNARLLPHHFDAACALYGAMDSDQKFRLTTFNEVQSGKFDSLFLNNAAIGSADFMEEVFKRIKKTPTLPLLSDRPYAIVSLAEARRKILSGEKLFIKPTRHKLFSGFVASSANINSIASMNDDSEVALYEPFLYPILSEWRIYISNGKVVDSRNYSGDFTISPNYEQVKAKIALLKNFPCAFVADIGIMEDHSDVIIEFNDMWAIENYGIDNVQYLELLVNRYFEILKA
jgi:hypothetical protein